MRPLKLTMTAFLCYAKTTEVDFESINGLFLIDGDTGAGKTSIFDAISFALYGTASGKERDVQTLHTDFVSKSVPTVVRLEFLHQGRRYTVERKIVYSKKRGTANEYNEPSKTATLWEEGKEPITNTSDVTRRCTELIGLNADQFRSVVMLPQGAFREFLNSDGSKKNEILGRLFDNTEYVRYQKLLIEVRGALKKKREQYDQSLSVAMGTLFKLPEGENAELYLSGHPALLENLSALIRREEEQLAELEAQADAREKAVTKQQQEYWEAEKANGLLEELRRAREKLAALEERRAETEAARLKYRTAEKAIRRVKPAADEEERARADFDRTNASIRQLEEELEKRTGERAEAEQAVHDDAPLAERRDSLRAEERKLTELLPTYDELGVKEKEANDARAEVAQTADALEEARKKKADLNERLRAAQGELEALSGADAELERRRNLLEKAQKRWNALTAPGTGIEASSAEVIAEEEKLEQGEKKLERLTKAASDAANEHNRLYQAFIAGQAGMMASGMRKELATSGQAVCPVCNSVFRTGDEVRFAELTEGTPLEADVDAADSARKQAEEARSNQHNRNEKLRAQLEQRRLNIIKDAAELDGGCDSWEALTAPGRIEALHSAVEAELERSTEQYRKALDDREKAKALEAEREDIVKRLEGLDSEIERLTKLGTEVAIRLKGLEASVAALRGQLAFPDACQAKKRIGELQEEIAGITARLDAHNNALRAAENKCTETEGRLKAHREALPGLESKLCAARERLEAALGENGFGDIGEYRAALPAGDADGESWLEGEKAKLDEYDNDVRSTGQHIAQLEKQTEGRERADLEALGAQLEESRSAREAAADACAEKKNLIGNHRDVFGKAAAAKAELSKTHKAFERIDRLASLAGGMKSSDGELSFDRFVMGTIFREVLAVASYRFEAMTNGKYSLEHAAGAKRKTSKAGLDIDVLDIAKGTRRPASSSFSGGEGFMASLALALGLSDVVQSRAGGQQLDALFIDEGFGSLDEARLANVLEVLQSLTENNRLVGIISHVEALDSISPKLCVKSTPDGSVIERRI